MNPSHSGTNLRQLPRFLDRKYTNGKAKAMKGNAIIPPLKRAERPIKISHRIGDSELSNLLILPYIRACKNSAINP
jgi:hypothetical protein